MDSSLNQLPPLFRFNELLNGYKPHSQLNKADQLFHPTTIFFFVFAIRKLVWKSFLRHSTYRFITNHLRTEIFSFSATSVAVSVAEIRTVEQALNPVPGLSIILTVCISKLLSRYCYTKNSGYFWPNNFSFLDQAKIQSFTVITTTSQKV